MQNGQGAVVEWKQIDNRNSYVFILHASSTTYNFTNDMNDINKVTVMYATLYIVKQFFSSIKR